MNFQSPKRSSGFQERVSHAAQVVLERDGSVGPLELFQEMGFLQYAHLQGWRKGNEYYPTLEPWIQVGAEKLQKTLQHFQDWVQERGLKPIAATYTRNSVTGILELQVTNDGDPRMEKFYRTHFAPADLPPKKTERLKAKLKKTPDLVVFQTVSEEGNCAECDTELFQGSLLVMEKGKPLCLGCADLDHLVFLPAGDTALTRRARKHSCLAAVVVRFNRARKRYERQGLLVTSEALAKAENECAADAPERAAARAKAEFDRQQDDREFISILTQEILHQFPECPPAEAHQIAAHAGLRNSGRVGRSAAGRAFEEKAIDLAVTAHIRHTHTKYDELLMQGTERMQARALVRDQIEKQLSKWRKGNS